MPIRVQPVQIDIPTSDPFANDLLKRQESIETLTTLLDNIEGPCVIAVDASWGMGKTTFLRMWQKYLEANCFPVITFNAWDADFSRDPFVALSSDLTHSLANITHGSIRGKALAFGRQSAGVVGRILQRSASAGLTAGLTTGPVAGGVAAGAAALNQVRREMTKERPTADLGKSMTYHEAKELLQYHRAQLTDLAEAVSDSREGRPLVILVDELDRCRPDFAIQFLEIAKHLFDVDHVIFVLALDREQLGHSIRVVYGSEFDSTGYLRRFFDLDFRLPSPDRTEFVNTKLDQSGALEQLQNGLVSKSGGHRAALDLARAFLSRSDLSLRQVVQATTRLGLALNSVPNDTAIYLDVLTVLCLLRMGSPAVYERMAQGHATDDEVVDALLGDPAVRAFRNTSSGAQVEATLLSCTALALASRHRDNILEHMPLLRRYAKWPGTQNDTLKIEQASTQRERIMHDIDEQSSLRIQYGLENEIRGPLDHLGFERARNHLELLAKFQIDE